MLPVKTIRCTHVVAQVSLGYYDAEGNLVGEEVFPQSQGNLIAAHLFHPHTEQLGTLIEACIEQAWSKLAAQAPADERAVERHTLNPIRAGEAGP